MADSNVSSTHKNPLAVAFGKALQRQRDQIGKTSGEVAEDMAIGAGYYRNIESGANNLHVNKALGLVNGLDGKIKLEGVVKLLGALSILEMRARQAMSEDLHYADGLERAAADLQALDHDLKELFEKFRRAGFFKRLKKDGPEEAEEAVSAAALDYEVLRFLTNPKDYGVPPEERQTDYLRTFFDDVPSIYVALLGNMRKQLLALPREFVFSALQAWEPENRDDFVRLEALIVNHQAIVHEANTEAYHFEYLLGSNFEEARFLFVDPPSSPAELQEMFAKNLRAAYKKHKPHEVDELDSALAKVRFGSVDSSLQLTKQLLQAPPGASSKRLMEMPGGYRAAWFISFKDNNNVCFLADAKKHPDIPEFEIYTHAFSLTQSESVEQIQKLRRLWDDHAKVS